MVDLESRGRMHICSFSNQTPVVSSFKRRCLVRVPIGNWSYVTILKHVRWRDGGINDGPVLTPDTWEPAGRTDDFSTYLPTLIGVAATWSPENAQAMGKGIGEEARKRGKDIMLGPGVNIQRTPLNGRTFEYMGEDPYLTGRLAVGSPRKAQHTCQGKCRQPALQ